jgi:hypothetical protein
MDETRGDGEKGAKAKVQKREQYLLGGINSELGHGFEASEDGPG